MLNLFNYFACQDCQCKWTVDAEELLTFFQTFNVKQLQDPTNHFDPIHVEKTVVDMASKEACDAICTHDDIGNAVNAWSYDYQERTCTCAWLTSVTCDWEPLVSEKDIGLMDPNQQTIAYIQLTKTLACSTYILVIK